MGRGLGWVQTACLEHIQKYERDDEWPTTYDLAAAVYQVKPDEDGISYPTDAQHVAVKRALEGLQRKGRIIGFRMGRTRGFPERSDHRIELCHQWMTEKRAQQWVRDKFASTRQLEHLKTKMQAIGMGVDESEPNHKVSNPRPHAGDASQGDQVN